VLKNCKQHNTPVSADGIICLAEAGPLIFRRNLNCIRLHNSPNHAPLDNRIEDPM
jgi:hypothetical protein